MFPRTTRAALWTVAVGLFVALIAPSVPLGQFAVGGLVGGVVILAVISVLELICVFARTKPTTTWTPGNAEQAEGRVHRVVPDEEWTDALVEGTAADLIDWDE